jgi:hypothetical protein
MLPPWPNEQHALASHHRQRSVPSSSAPERTRAESPSPALARDAADRAAMDTRRFMVSRSVSPTVSRVAWLRPSLGHEMHESQQCGPADACHRRDRDPAARDTRAQTTPLPLQSSREKRRGHAPLPRPLRSPERRHRDARMQGDCESGGRDGERGAAGPERPRCAYASRRERRDLGDRS